MFLLQSFLSALTFFGDHEQTRDIYYWPATWSEWHMANLSLISSQPSMELCNATHPGLNHVEFKVEFYDGVVRDFALLLFYNFILDGRTRDVMSRSDVDSLDK